MLPVEHGVERGTRLRALHEVALSINGPLPALADNPDGVIALLSRIVSLAAEAAGAYDGRLVLAEDPAWRHLVAGSPPSDGLITVGRQPAARRAPWPEHSATMHVLTTGEPVFVTDVAAPSPFGPFSPMLAVGIKSFATLPLRLGGQVVGRLGLSFQESGALAGETRELLEILASHAAAAVERVRRAYVDDRSVRRAGQLATALAQLGGAPDLESALAAVLHSAVALLAGDAGFVHLFRTSADTQLLTFCLRPDGTLTRTTSDDASPGSVCAALLAGGPACVVGDLWALESLEALEDSTIEPARTRGMRSSANVPVSTGGQCIGVLTVEHHDASFFDEADLPLLAVLATQAATIVQRARLEDLLVAREQRFRTLIERSSDGVWLTDAEGTLQYVSPAATHILGYEPEELAGTPVLARVHPDDEAAARSAQAALHQLPGAVKTAVVRFRHRDGSWRWIETISTNLLDAPDVEAVVTNFRDVTERTLAAQSLQETNRRLEAALAESTRREHTIARQAEQLRALDDLARAAGGTLDLDAVGQLVVQRVTTLLDCAGAAVHRLDPAADRLRLLAHWPPAGLGLPDLPAECPIDAHPAGRAVRTRAPSVYVNDPGNPSNGTALPAAAETAAIGFSSLITVPVTVDGAVWGTLGIGFRDAHSATAEHVSFLGALAAHLAIMVRNAELVSRLEAALTELQATQQHVVQQERLRALGEMASGIAHDFNNTLVPIVGLSELLLLRPEELGDIETVRDYVRLIHASAKDAADVVGRLKEFYRPREERERFVPVDLRHIVDEAVLLTQPKWRDQSLAEGRQIAVHKSLGAVPLVAGKDAELREALTNLIFNAVDAMPDGGTVTLSTHSERGHATIEIADTGTGMTEEVRRQCLEPFYTTKGPSGTGLGLSMVHGIVRRHEGTLTIRTAPGRGTTIVIRVPALAEAEAEAAAAAAPSAARNGGTGDGTFLLGGNGGAPAASGSGGSGLRVLVVDDEPSVRRVLSRYLERDGHSVVLATDGREGLAAFRAGTFDAVVTDRAMPGMTGDQLARLIKDTSPGTPVLMLTGFGDLMTAAGELPEGIDRILCKPLSVADLRQALAETAQPSSTARSLRVPDRVLTES